MSRITWLRCWQSIFMPDTCAIWKPIPSGDGYVSIGATVEANIREDGSYDVCDSLGNIYRLPAFLAKEHFIEV